MTLGSVADEKYVSAAAGAALGDRGRRVDGGVCDKATTCTSSARLIDGEVRDRDVVGSTRMADGHRQRLGRARLSHCVDS